MRWQKHDVDELRSLAEQGCTKAEIAEALHTTVGSVKDKMRREGIKSKHQAKTAEPKEGMSISETGDGRIVTLHSKTVRTLDAALKTADVDRDSWEVERWIANKWDQGSKQKDLSVQVVELWQVKVWLRRIAPKPITDAIEALCQRLPIAPASKPTAAPLDPHLLEVALFDTHLGKLCWGHETGTPYDVKIARRVYANAVEDLLARVRGYPVERVLFPLGQDFFQVDNWIGTTHQGTQVDTDGRFQRTFEAGVEAVIIAVNVCLDVAPVKVMWVPGNHDRTTSWYLAKLVQAHFRDDERVVVNAAPTARKYHRFGASLIGFTHGDEEPHRDLPTIMAGEEPEAWAATTCREWHVGHKHKRKETRYSAGDTFGAVGVRMLPSLSGTDAWHYRKGYVQGRRAAEAYLWSKRDGYTGHFSVNVRRTG